MPGTAYNSLQNPRMYEHLRRQGYSKRAAARIANARTPGHRVTHKAGYDATAGQQISGNLYRGAGGKFTAGSGGNQTPAQARQNARRQERSDYGRAEDALRQAEDEAIAKEPNRHKRAALRRATIIARRKRLYARREQRRQMDEQDQFARNQEAQERARATAERRARRIAEVLARREAAAQARAERQRRRDEERARKPAKQPKAPKQPSAEAIERQRKRDEAKAIKLRDAADEDAFRDIEDQLLDAAPDAKARQKLRRQFAKERRDRARKRREGQRVAPPVPTKPPSHIEPRKRAPRGPLKPRPQPRLPGDTRDIPGQKSHDLIVYKDATGAYRWIAISSTAYRDRDGEIISTKALIGAVEKGDTSGSRGVLRFWHVPGLDLGECDYQATAHDGKLLIESGTFYRPDYALALKERGRGWGVSPGFLHSPDQPDRHGVFHDITIFERSICPPGKASNLFTSITTKESRMSLTPDKDTQLAALLGGRESAAYKAATASIEATEKTAQASGVTFKSADEGLPLLTDESGAQYTVKEGRLIALKAMDAPPVVEAKAEMSPEAMIEAGEMEQEDGEAELDVEDLLSDGDVRRVAAAVIEGITPFFDIQKQVGELKGALGGMGTGQAVATKETPATDPQAMIAQMIAASQASNQTVKQAPAQPATVPSTAELMAQIAAMQQTIKELKGDQPLAASSRATQSAETIVGADNPLVAGYKAVTDNPDGIVANFMNGFVRPG